MLNIIVFYILAGIAVLSAALMVTRRNARHSALLLFAVLLAAAGIFLQLHARVLFAMQLLLFAGLTMAMFFFTARELDLDGTLREMRFARQKWMVLLIVAAAAGEAGLMYWSIRKRPIAKLLALTTFSAGKLEPNALAVLHTMFNTYLLSIEIAVLLVFISAVAVVTVNRKRA